MFAGAGRKVIAMRIKGILQWVSSSRLGLGDIEAEIELRPVKKDELKDGQVVLVKGILQIIGGHYELKLQSGSFEFLNATEVAAIIEQPKPDIPSAMSEYIPADMPMKPLCKSCRVPDCARRLIESGEVIKIGC